VQTAVIATVELKSGHAVRTLACSSMKKAVAVKNYYILPCLLLLLNLVNNVVSYKAGMIDDVFLRTAVVILLVLFGGTVVAFLLSPALEKLVQALHRATKSGAGGLGEVLFLIALGALVFWLYYQMTANGIESLLPAEWRNPTL
jgi:cytochrome c oxidase subunit IV